VGFFKSVTNLFTKETISGDVVPGSTGEYGFESSNPIPTAGVSESDRYLGKLRTLDGNPVSNDRVGSTSSHAVPGRLCDIYLLRDGNGKELGRIYICPYFNRTSQMPPRGFMLQETFGRAVPAGASLEESFKHMALDAFPAGHNQVLRESHELRALLDRALSLDECTNVVTKTKALFLISKDRSFDRMNDSINTRAGGKLSVDQTKVVFDYLNDKFKIVRPYASKKEQADWLIAFKQHLADAVTAFNRKQYEQAIASIRLSLRHVEINNEDGAVAQMLAFIGKFADVAGEKALALDYHRRVGGVYLFNPTKPDANICKSVATCGRRMLEIGKYPDGEEYSREALAIADKLGSRVTAGAVIALFDLAWLHRNVKGNVAEAERLDAEAESIKAKFATAK
jgi:hypothetical protein